MFRMCKSLIMFSLTFILKFIISLLGLVKKKHTYDGCHDSHTDRIEPAKIDIVKETRRISYPGPNRNFLASRRDQEPGSSGDATDESPDDTCFTHAPRKAHIPRSRRCALGHGLPRTSSSLNVYNRQYNSSSGFSTTSDVIISELNTLADQSLDSGIARSNVTESDNVELKKALDVLNKEKLELQENLLHQYKRQSRTINLLKEQCAESEENCVYKSRCLALQDILGLKNLVVEECPTEHHRFNSSCSYLFNKKTGCHCKREHDDPLCSKRYSSALEPETPLSSRRYSSILDADVHVEMSKVDAQHKDEMLHKIRILEKDNVRLNEYINGLLFMVLENSPSMLEAKETKNYHR